MTASDDRCPVAFDPFDATYLDDPYVIYPARVAEAGPRYQPDLDLWVVARHDQVLSIFRDPETFSSGNAQDPLLPMCPEAAAVLAQGFRPLKTMTNLDGPEHSRIRKHNMVGFSPRRLRALEPLVRATATDLIDALPGDTEFDLVATLTFPLPATVIFGLLGFPPTDTAMLKSWCGDRLAFSFGRPAPDQQVQIAHDMRDYWRYCGAFVARQLDDPGDSFTGDLLRIHLDDPSTLSVQEITSIVYGLSFAGHETTTNMISNTLRRLLEQRELWDALVADPTLATAAAAEAVRHDSSVITWRRQTTRDVIIGDAAIPAGARLLLLLGAANRDPERFEDPDEFRLGRPNTGDALSFGWGKHFCIGATLAKLEVAVVLEEMTRRHPELRLVDQRLTFDPNVSFRGPQQLWAVRMVSGTIRTPTPNANPSRHGTDRA